MSKKTSTSMSCELLRANGYIAQNVEHYNPWAKKRKDLFGFIDIVAVNSGSLGVLGVQATVDKGNGLARIQKIISIPEARTWLLARNKIEVHAWVKKIKRPPGEPLWRPFVTEIFLDFSGSFQTRDISWVYIL